MFLKCATLFVRIMSFVSSANILAIIPTPSYSHQVAFHDFWSELSRRGHQVTVITTDPERNPELTNLTEIDIHWVYKYFANISDLAENSLTMWNVHRWVHDATSAVSEAMLSHPQFQELIGDKGKHFDVVLLESFYVELLGIGEIYNCPSILVCSFDALTPIHQRMGNPTTPALYPDELSSLHAPLSFMERVTSMINYLYIIFFYEYVSFPLREELMRNFFNTTSTINELIYNVDLILANTNPAVQLARAVGPAMIRTGNLRLNLAKPLPNDLKLFLDNATGGFVYFSLGSNVKSKDLHKESLRNIVGVLKELPYQVLWKFEASEDSIPFKASNVKLMKWTPQPGILAHRNIKVFVTQGGLQSMEEAIFYEVPCVVIPFFSDQHRNAKIMRIKGMAEVVDRSPYIMKNTLKTAIMKVTKNPQYKDSVKRLKRLSLDTPLTNLENAIWWTEYVIRNKGAKHLRNPSVDLPLCQYYLLDVFGFLILVAVITLSIIIILLKKIMKLFRRRYLFNKYGLDGKKSQ